MLGIDIHWLVPVTVLCSDRVLKSRMENIRSSYEDLPLELALRDYQFYLEQPLRNEDISHSINSWFSNQQGVDTKLILCKIKKYFLSWNGDRFEVKIEKLEEWLSLISIIDPSWIIAVGYVELIENKVLGIEQLLNCLYHQCPCSLPKRFDGKDIADNHVHLNGHGHNALSLLDFSLYLTKKPSAKRTNWPYRPECSFFNSNSLDLTLLPLMVNQTFSSLVASLWLEDHRKFPTWEELLTSQINTNTLITLEKVRSRSDYQKLLSNAHLSDLPEPARWLMITIALLLARKQSDKVVRSRIDIYINSCNLLRNYMVMSGVGLGTFVDYFSFKLRKPTSRKIRYKSHSLSNDLSENTHREFRGSPNLIVEESWNKNSLNSKFKLNPTELSNLATELVSQGLEDRTHFVIHFNRGFSKIALKGDNTQSLLRRNLLIQVRKIQTFFSSISYADTTMELGEPLQFKHSSADLRALIRGFDVAGNENEIPIEIFAPALRVLRASKHECQSKIETRLRQPFLTVHAGEDYNHLLTGLRAIDETVLFCDFKPGDRLGHALALGVNVYDWAKKQTRIYLTAEQHLDNLVWCYHQGLELIQICPDFHSTLSIIENKISRWASYIYDDINCTPSVLFDAWKLRRNCPSMIDLPSQFSGTEWEIWMPDSTYISDHKNSIVVKIWERYLNKNIKSLSRKNLRSSDIVTINFRTSCNQLGKLSENMTSSELKLIHAIQDLLIERYSKRQITIEACPTSNIFIGRFEKYVEHPIFRWNPPVKDWIKSGERFNVFGIRNGSINVCINTDDAGIMPTTIENEHRILKQTAISELKVGFFDADIWIDKVRQVGVDIFKSNHLSWINYLEL